MGALIHLSGELKFINNSGGALYMQSFAQAVLKKRLSIMFEGNSGRSAISHTIDILSIYKQTKLCTNISLKCVRITSSLFSHTQKDCLLIILHVPRLSVFIHSSIAKKWSIALPGKNG